MYIRLSAIVLSMLASLTFVILLHQRHLVWIVLPIFTGLLVAMNEWRKETDAFVFSVEISFNVAIFLFTSLLYLYAVHTFKF